MNRLEEAIKEVEKEQAVQFRRKRLYVAGAMSSNNSLVFLNNLARGIHTSAYFLRLGYAVFSPFVDFQFFLSLRGDEQISKNTIQLSSLSWLLASDAVYVIPGWENSEGTKREIQVATESGIKVFYDINQLIKEMKP